MRSWHRLVILFFLVPAACGPAPTEQPTLTIQANEALGTFVAPTQVQDTANWSDIESNMQAMWQGNPSLATTVLAPGFAPSSPYDDLFGSSDLAQTLPALQTAIPDLKLNWRMRAHEYDWAAWAFELSGTFSAPLVVKAGTIPPTNRPFFSVIHMMVHADLNDQIDQEYVAADTPSMMELLGRPVFADEQVGDVALEMPLPAEISADDSALAPVVSEIAAKIMNGSPFLLIPPDVSSFGILPMTYHSPFGDVVNGIPPIERELLRVAGAELHWSQAVHEGNLFAAAYDYNGKPYDPFTVTDGVQLNLNNSILAFEGIVLFEVKPSGEVELWNLYNRADLARALNYYGPWTGTEGQATATEPAVVPTDSATPTVVSAAACALTARGNVNLRSGPGTTFARAGALAAGVSQAVIGQAKGGDGLVWWKLENGSWVRSDLVQTSGDCTSMTTVGS